MAKAEIELVVGAWRYGGWKSVRVTRSIESIAGSFALDVSDRWGALNEPWPIVEEDPCRVEIDGETVIDGFVDKRSISATKDARTLSYTGRDRAAVLVDCSAILGRWTHLKVTLADFAAKIAEPFGVGVSVEPGLELGQIAKVTVSPGDTAYEAIMHAAAAQGVLLVSDGKGGLLITRSGTARAAPLIEGGNILTASVEYDGEERFRHYVIAGQAPGTDDAFGDATRVLTGASDDGVRRTDRVLLIQPDRGYSAADARRLADWEARRRAARAETVTITVLGWRQPDGDLWPLNARARVKAPRLIGVDDDMLISQVEHSIGEAGQITQLRLVRPDAFTPEPQKAIVKARPARTTGLPELRRGGAFDIGIETSKLSFLLDRLKGF